MSDLQCAATLLLVPYGTADDHARALADARVAHIWTASSEEARLAAAALAADLGVGVTANGDLDQAEPSAAVLGAIADEHRGETVVVVVDHGEAVLEVAIDGDGSVRRTWPA
jgi:hypothetical protein